MSPQTKQGWSRVTSHMGRAGKGVYSARRKLATGGAAVLAVMVGYHVVFGQNGLTAYREKRRVIRELQGESRDLQTDNTRLRNHVDRLSNDPNAIEHEARESLHYTRPGEVIYTLPPDKAASR